MGKILNKHDHSLAHAYCSNNKPELEKDKICGCFFFYRSKLFPHLKNIDSNFMKLISRSRSEKP